MSKTPDNDVDSRSSATAAAADMEPVKAMAEPASSSNLAMTAFTEYASYSPTSTHKCWAVVSAKAPHYEPTTRASVDLVAVIDRSGSMTGSKIEMVKEAMLFVINQLKETDRFSLVVYDANAEVKFELINMTAENKKEAKSVVEAVAVGSCTNLCAGLIQGIDQIMQTNNEKHKAKVQSVLLFTDGLATTGITDQSNILQQMKLRIQGIKNMAVKVPSRTEPAKSKHPLVEKSSSIRHKISQLIWHTKAKGTDKNEPGSEKKTGHGLASYRKCEEQHELLHDTRLRRSTELCVGYDTKGYESSVDLPDHKDKFSGTVYTFGFGCNHCASLLEAISTQGGGVYYFVDSSDKIPECFADCLGGLLSVVGQNMKLKLDSQNECQIKVVHANRSIQWNQPGKSCEVAMGDIQSEESRDIVVELELPSMPSDIALEQVPLVKAELTYFNVITSQLDNTQCLLTTNRIAGPQGKSNVLVDAQRNRVMITQSFMEADRLASQHKYAEARHSIRYTMENLMLSSSAQEELTQSLIRDSSQSIKKLEDSKSYTSSGKHFLSSRTQSHAIQRTNYIDDQDMESAYRNTSKSVCIQRAKTTSSKN